MRIVNSKGSLSVELVAGLVVVVFIALCIIDLTGLACAAQYNFVVCTEAAQVAASGPPDQADLRASAVVNRSGGTNNSLVVWKLVMPQPPQVSLAGSTINQLEQSGGPVVGTVIVSTKIDVNMRVLGPLLGQDTVTLVANRTFPFTYCYPPP
jgi:hypothetical protein